MPGGLTQVVRVAQIDQSTALRRRRPQVQLLPWTPFFAPVPQQQQGEFRKLVRWPCANTRCESDQGPHQDCGVISSISPCEGDGPGANPGFLTIFNNLRVHVSPVTVMTIVRCRGLTSHSKWKTCCHVPKTKFPSLMGTVSDGPSIVACKCEWPLPSCQACSWP